MTLNTQDVIRQLQSEPERVTIRSFSQAGKAVGSVSRPVIRPNKYEGHCAECKLFVTVAAGRIEKNSQGRWEVRHLAGECPISKAPPTSAVTAPAPYVVTEGIYKVGETIYKVQPARTSDNLYAKELILREDAAAEWEYVGKRPFQSLNVFNRLSLEEAKEFGKTHGICCVCGAMLTAEDSMEAGIGPVCAGRF